MECYKNIYGRFQFLQIVFPDLFIEYFWVPDPLPQAGTEQ